VFLPVVLHLSVVAKQEEFNLVCILLFSCTLCWNWNCKTNCCIWSHFPKHNSINQWRCLLTWLP